MAESSMMSNQGELFPAADDPSAPRPPESLWPSGFELEHGFLAQAEAERVMEELAATIPWERDEIMMYGKRLPVPRLTAWFGDRGADYVYSGVRNVPRPWTATLAGLRDLVAARCGVTFNSVLLNLYRDGSDSVAWHRDDEPELGRAPTIGSLSLGATRRFRLRNRESGHALGWDLESGSLLVMSGASQGDWEHCVSKTKRPVGARINLTFRQIAQAQRPSAPNSE